MNDEQENKPTEAKTEEKESATIYYVIGGVVLIAVVAGIYLLRPKSPGPASPATQGQTTTAAAPQPTPTPAPISKLACEQTFFNPVIGFAKYHFSVAGVDLPTTTDADCTFNVLAGGTIVATETVKAKINQAPDRGGIIVRCDTKALEVAPGPVQVDTTIKNNGGQTATCLRAAYTLPKP